jgi:hypothetical protein
MKKKRLEYSKLKLITAIDNSIAAVKEKSDTLSIFRNNVIANGKASREEYLSRVLPLRDEYDEYIRSTIKGTKCLRKHFRSERINVATYKHDSYDDKKKVFVAATRSLSGINRLTKWATDEKGIEYIDYKVVVPRLARYVVDKGQIDAADHLLEIKARIECIDGLIIDGDDIPLEIFSAPYHIKWDLVNVFSREVVSANVHEPMRIIKEEL